MKSAGFTLVEMVVTIGILAIVAAVAAPRFFQASTFDSRGFYDKSAAVIRLAQKTAIAWRRPVFVCIAAGQVRAGAAAGCATALTYPVNGAAASETAPAGVTLNTLAFGFDGSGCASVVGRCCPSTEGPCGPSAAFAINFNSTIAGDPVRMITIANQTGYVSAH